MQNADWFVVDGVESIASPALLFYEDRIRTNLDLLLGMIDDAHRLRPHVKTHKSAELTKLMLQKGIHKFKCATIAEAEMLGQCEAPDVLLAYQPVGPNIPRFLQLVQQYPNTQFSCLVDAYTAAEKLAQESAANNLITSVYLDLNVGMNRTGILPEKAKELASKLIQLDGIKLLGLHAYDGHIHDADYSIRKEKADEITAQLTDVKKDIEESYANQIQVIAGGTPTFPIYATQGDFDCSPGTFALWDKGYQDAFAEQAFLPAALILCRIVSLPAPGLICVDLGHKAVAAENVLQKRVVFLNAPDLEPIGQSEEHLVLKVPELKTFQIGDVLYGLPFHICPTVALHETATVVSARKPVATWPITSRKRKITI